MSRDATLSTASLIYAALVTSRIKGVTRLSEAKRRMRPSAIVVGDPFGQYATQMPFVEGE
jgi:hypothetical protein